MRGNFVAVSALAAAAQAASLKDVKHIVLFMQENRAFDHVSDTLTPAAYITLPLTGHLAYTHM